MKLLHIIPAMMLGAATLLCSCEDMLDLKSDSYVYDEDNRLNQANDSLYSAMGILTQLQPLGESYVLLGELRGDLMDVTSDAPVSLQEIASFNVSTDNIYNSKRRYYSVINNCNYALARMDTTITEHLNRVMLPEYVAIKTLRAWTYLQMGLTYGRVQYIEKPLLSLEETEMNYPVVELDALVDKLVADLERYAGEEVPSYGSDDVLSTHRFFMSPRLLLADLYLYRNDYASAARFYYDYIAKNNITISDLSNTWTTNQAVAAKENLFITSYIGETLVEIPYSSDPARIHPNLINLTYNPKPTVVAAPWWVEEMGKATHFHVDNNTATAVSGILEGDLRGRFLTPSTGVQIPVSFGTVAGTTSPDYVLVTKFFNSAAVNATLTNPDNPLAAGAFVRELPIYRNSHVYLRYAEALNRLGKHTLAFAILKYGLTPDVMADPTKIDPAELEDAASWTNFSSQEFQNNTGTASRGRGKGIVLSQSTFNIPQFDTEAELTEWIEDAIVDEMAAETQFEGNRFFDLMRVSRHRGGTGYFADRVSRRFPNPAAAKALLSNRESWWLK